MTTALSIIKQAMKKINVLGRGQALQDDEAQDGLTALNNLLGSWSVEGGLVFTESKDTFPLTGAVSYSIGTGADFNMDKPYDITACYVRQGTTDYPLNMIDEVQYSEISTKATGGLPSMYYYDNNFPTANIYFYTVPDSSYTATIYSVKPLEKFTSLTDDISLPNGYERALVLNLAIEIAPNFEKEPSITVSKLALEAKDNVFAYNTRNSSITSTIDGSLIQNNGFNIYTGEYN